MATITRPTIKTGITRNQAAHLALGDWPDFLAEVTTGRRRAVITLTDDNGTTTKEGTILGTSIHGDLVFQVKGGRRMLPFGPSYNNGTLHAFDRMDFPAQG